MTISVIQNELGTYILTSQRPFRFICGHAISQIELAYETYGKLNAAKDNAILIHHALSTGSHVASHAANPEPGWWEIFVGPKKVIDTNKFFVVCINNLGSCFGSTGPSSINPLTGSSYRMDFPHLDIRDIVHSQSLVLNYLGIEQLHAVISPSMGAMISLYHAILYPSQVKRLISISSSARSYPYNIGIRSVQREIIKLDPAWQNGHYQQNFQGFITARKLAHLTYRNPTELNERFLQHDIEHPERTIHSYLNYNANKFTQYFDANCYLYLTAAMDEFDVTDHQHGNYQQLSLIQAKVRVISVDTDILFAPEQQSELYQLLIQAGVEADYINYSSSYGHDAFLVEHEMGNYIANFI